jgi:SMC interacting uncharacterized protein involved in chromosome segregation
MALQLGPVMLTPPLTTTVPSPLPPQMPLEQKEQKAQDAHSDLLKFQQYKVKLTEHRNKLEAQINEKQEELRERQTELEQGRAEKLRLQTKIKSQDLNMADVERMAQEKARMNDAMQVATVHKDELQQKVWNLQSDIDAKTEELQQFVGWYSSSTEALQLRPPTAEFAQGLNFSIDFETESRDRIFQVDLIKVIKPALMNVKARATQRLMAAHEQEMELQDEVETSADAVSHARQESGKLETKVKQAEAQCRREKEQAKQTLDRIGVESDSVEDDIVQMREGDKEGREAELAEQQQLLRQMQTKLAVQREAHMQLQEQVNNEIMETLQGLTDHKTHMQTQLARTKAYINEKKKELESEE